MTGIAGGSSTSFGALRLTYPSPPDLDLAGLQREESESDILPFAIDGDAGSPFDVAASAADDDTGKPLYSLGPSCLWTTSHAPLV